MERNWCADCADHDVTPLMRPQPGDAFRRDNSTLTELSKPPAYARFQQVYQRRLALMQGQRPWGMAGAPAGRPVGMVNLGNTCYLNAVLQVGRWHGCCCTSN